MNILGAQIMTGNLVGAGQTKKVNRLFTGSFVVLTVLFSIAAVCSFNNDLKRSYVAIGTMIAGNLIGNRLLIESCGLFGVGLASTISSTATFLVMLPGFFKKDKLFHFDKNSGFELRLVIQAARRGLPSLMLTAGVVIKNLCFNFSMEHAARKKPAAGFF